MVWTVGVVDHRNHHSQRNGPCRGLAQPPVVEGPVGGSGEFVDEAPASPFAWVGDVLRGFRVGVIIYLLIWIAAVVHAYFAAKKFNRKNETVVK